MTKPNLPQIAELLRSFGIKVRAVGSDYIAFHAAHREDAHASCSLSIRGGEAWVKDFAEGRSWPAREYLERFVTNGLPVDELLPGVVGGRGKARSQGVKAVVFDLTAHKPLDARAEKELSALYSAYRANLNFRRAPTDYAVERFLLIDNYEKLKVKVGGKEYGVGLTERGALVFPVFLVHQEGDSFSVEFRNLHIRHPKGDMRFSYALSGVGHGFIMFGSTEAPRHIFLTEGATDSASVYLILLHHGHRPEDILVIGVPGANIKPTEPLVRWLAKFVEGGAVLRMRFDDDEAGRRADAVWQEALAHYIDPERVILIPHDNLGFDWNALAVKRGFDDPTLGARLMGGKQIHITMSPVRNRARAVIAFTYLNKGTARKIAEEALTDGQYATRSPSAISDQVAFNRFAAKLSAALQELAPDMPETTTISIKDIASLGDRSKAISSLVRIGIAAELPEDAPQRAQEQAKACEMFRRRVKNALDKGVLELVIGTEYLFAWLGVKYSRGKADLSGLDYKRLAMLIATFIRAEAMDAKANFEPEEDTLPYLEPGDPRLPRETLQENLRKINEGLRRNPKLATGRQVPALISWLLAKYEELRQDIRAVHEGERLAFWAGLALALGEAISQIPKYLSYKELIDQLIQVAQQVPI